MIRARTITLVLVGGGLALGTAGIVGAVTSSRARDRECTEARAQRRPDAEQICARASAYRSSGGTYYGSSSSGYRGGGGGSWFFGRSAGATPAAFSSSGSVSRGGFGGSAAAFSGGS